MPVCSLRGFEVLRRQWNVCSRFEILNDPERAFAASDFVRLEVLPKALYFHQQAEAAFYEAYFATVKGARPVR
jgi:hypothetical protein